jgi:hypothetical protein
MSKTLYEAWGPDKSIKAFVHYPANTFPGQIKKLEDNTHFNPYGAYELARCIVKQYSKTKFTVSQVNQKGYNSLRFRHDHYPLKNFIGHQV